MGAMLKPAQRVFRVDGIFIDVHSMPQAVTTIPITARAGRDFGFHAQPRPLEQLRADPKFRAAYHRARFVTADGFPISWLGRLNGVGVKRTDRRGYVGAALSCRSCKTGSRCSASARTGALFGRWTNCAGAGPISRGRLYVPGATSIRNRLTPTLPSSAFASRCAALLSCHRRTATGDLCRPLPRPRARRRFHLCRCRLGLPGRYAVACAASLSKSRTRMAVAAVEQSASAGHALSAMRRRGAEACC